VALIVAACTGSPGGRPPAASGDPSEAAPAVTAAESRAALAGYASRADKAVAAGDATAWAGTAAGALRRVVAAEAVMAGGKPPKNAAITLTNPAMYVPRLTGRPRWFATAVLQRQYGKAREVLFVFVQDKPGDPWLPVHRLPFSHSPPEIATDAQGYAMAASDAASPTALPAAHAAYLNGSADAVVPDAYSRTRPPGRYVPGTDPIYALRTKDGGDLVWYALTQTDAYAKDVLPPQVRAYLHGQKRPVTATWTWQAIAYIPPHGTPTVLGEQVTLTAVR
jgi:hypothetical protein